uniref:Uncharacterized protein n=1 Tax=Heterorhabditis bacteriophora TaxID=37862 RepID=A0A1I7W5X8_HETBA
MWRKGEFRNGEWHKIIRYSPPKANKGTTKMGITATATATKRKELSVMRLSATEAAPTKETSGAAKTTYRNGCVLHQNGNHHVEEKCAPERDHLGHPVENRGENYGR